MSNIVHLQGFGGGTPLRFKVISCPSANDLPLNSKENTIALISSLYSGQYEFSTTAPSTASHGKAWIQVAASSAFGFSATKKNPLWVYPVKCLIYDSRWKDVESFIYQAGSWKSFGTAHLYDLGDEKVPFTGGWSVGSPPYSGIQGLSGGLYRRDTYLEVVLDPTTMGSSANIGETLRCENLIDLTPYKTLTFQGTFKKLSSNSNAWYACWTSLGDSYQDNVAAVKKVTTDSIVDVVLDVSSLTGEHVVGVGVRACAVIIRRCFLRT